MNFISPFQSILSQIFGKVALYQKYPYYLTSCPIYFSLPLFHEGTLTCIEKTYPWRRCWPTTTLNMSNPSQTNLPLNAPISDSIFPTPKCTPFLDATPTCSWMHPFFILYFLVLSHIHSHICYTPFLQVLFPDCETFCS